MTQATSRPAATRTDVELYKEFLAAIDRLKEVMAESAARAGKLDAWIEANDELAELRQKPAPDLVSLPGGKP